jgi:hypothetical protein
MKFLKQHLFKFRTFHIFFSTLVGIGFIFFSYSILEDPLRDLLNFTVGFLLTYPVAFFVTVIYELLADGTFKRMWIFYLMIAISINLTFVFQSPELLNYLFFSIFILTCASAIIFTIWKFYKQIGVLLFHLVTMFFWLLFVVLYHVNIKYFLYHI